MKFKGVVTKKGNGKAVGDVIEFSPEEKVKVALGVALTKHAAFDGHLVHAKSVKIEGLDYSTNGDLLKRMWQNNSYVARGRVEVGRRHMEKDEILRPVTYGFSIQVEDCLCQNGLPDLKTGSLELNPV